MSTWLEKINAMEVGDTLDIPGKQWGPVQREAYDAANQICAETLKRFEVVSKPVGKEVYAFFLVRSPDRKG